MTVTAPPAQPIRVQGLEKSYKDLHVLRGVDFGVARGSIFGAARLQRRGQDHGGEDLVHAAQGGCGDGQHRGLLFAAQPAEVRESISLTGQFAAVDGTPTGRETRRWWPGCGT